MFYLDTFLHIVAYGAVFVAGVIIGVIIGYMSYDHAIEKSPEKGTKRRAGDRRRKVYNKKTKKVEAEERRVTHYAVAEIRAPILDSAGVVMENEEMRFSAQLIDISRRGAGIISQNFLKIGLDIQFACSGEKLDVGFRPAQVRNVTLRPNGVRIGIQFFEPIEGF